MIRERVINTRCVSSLNKNNLNVQSTKITEVLHNAGRPRTCLDGPCLHGPCLHDLITKCEKKHSEHRLSPQRRTK